MAAIGEVLVEVKDVSFRYPKSTSGVSDINLTVRQGERVLLLGKNGSGKSTLLSLVGGKRDCAKGSVTVLGRHAFDDTSLNHEVALIGPPWPPESYFNCSVERVASPAPDIDRRDHIARELHLPLSANIDHMSAGEKRRVQVLHGLLRPPTIMLLDECSTEIDVAERRRVLQLAAEECSGPKKACAIYATHILDGVEEWATRVVVVEEGRILRDEPFGKHLAGDKLLAHRWLAHKPFTAFEAVKSYPFAIGDKLQKDAIAVECNKLSFRGVLEECSFRIPKGSRTLLVGCNGTGKTTLLHLLAGKTFFANKDSELLIHGHRCFQDIAPLNRIVSFGGDWWTRVPGGEMHVGQLVQCPLTLWAHEVAMALEIDLLWDVRYVSVGERKRIQLLLALEHPSEVILLDEATADLDLDMRHMLLHHLLKLSIRDGITILYTTHIFEGLENWATDCIVLDRNQKGVHRHLRAGEDDPIDLQRLIQTMIELKAKETWFALK